MNEPTIWPLRPAAWRYSPRSAAPRRSQHDLDQRRDAGALRRIRETVFVGGRHETITHYSFNGGADDRCRYVNHKSGSSSGSSGLVGLARTGWLPGLWLCRLPRLLWLWHLLQLPGLYRLQLPSLWLRLQLSG